MSDTKQAAPTLPAFIGPNYSIEVPTPAGPDPAAPAPATTYFRIGNPDNTSAREVAYFGTAFATQKPGMLLLTSGDMKFVTSATTTIKDAAESLAVVRVGTNIVSSSYSYQDGDLFRDVGFKKNHSTSWSLADSQSFKIAASTDVAITNDQKISAGAGLSLKMTTDTTIPLGLMSLTSDWSGMEIKSEFGNFKLNNKGKLSGADDVSITVSPLTATYLVGVERANKALVALTGVITTGLAAAMMECGFESTGQKGTAAKGDFDYAFETAMKNNSKKFATVCKVELGLMSVMQAAFIPLGIVGITAGKALDTGPFPTIKMNKTSITLSVGLTNLTLTATGISMQSTRLSTLDLLPQVCEVSAPQIVLKSGLTSTMTIMPASISLNAPTTSIRGTMSVGVGSPSVSFTV